MNIDEHTYIKRKREFSELVELYRDNVIVHHCIEQYANGIIVTKEETLMQMVKLLAEDSQSKQDKLMDWMKCHSISPLTVRTG